MLFSKMSSELITAKNSNGSKSSQSQQPNLPNQQHSTNSAKVKKTADQKYESTIELKQSMSDFIKARYSADSEPWVPSFRPAAEYKQRPDANRSLPDLINTERLKGPQSASYWYMQTEAECKQRLDAKHSLPDLIKSGQTKYSYSSSMASCTFPPDRTSHQLEATSSQLAFGDSSQTNFMATTSRPLTKVKSASWKRSDKQTSNHNAVGGKKTKSHRRRSPVWRKLVNSPLKIAENFSSHSDSTSVRRPGTTYSDVLFDDDSFSSPEKAKPLPPHRNMAHKNLTKALVKTNRNQQAFFDNKTGMHLELFPSLNETNKTGSSPAKASRASNVSKYVTELEDVATNELSIRDKSTTVVRPNMHSSVVVEKFFIEDLTWGTRFYAAINSARCDPSSRRQLFSVDIPDWNYLDVDLRAGAYPKSLCQFTDEHYRNTEQTALIGLKLALGNNYSKQHRFKL